MRNYSAAVIARLYVPLQTMGRRENVSPWYYAASAAIEGTFLGHANQPRILVDARHVTADNPRLPPESADCNATT